LPPACSKKKPEILEHLLDDQRDGETLEDAAVARLREEPNPWHDLGTILGQVTDLPALREEADDAAELALTLVDENHRDRHRRSKKLGR
jgi:hypothetical protein